LNRIKRIATQQPWPRSSHVLSSAVSLTSARPPTQARRTAAANGRRTHGRSADATGRSSRRAQQAVAALVKARRHGGDQGESKRIHTRLRKDFRTARTNRQRVFVCSPWSSAETSTTAYGGRTGPLPNTIVERTARRTPSGWGPRTDSRSTTRSTSSVLNGSGSEVVIWSASPTGPTRSGSRSPRLDQDDYSSSHYAPTLQARRGLDLSTDYWQ